MGLKMSDYKKIEKIGIGSCSTVWKVVKISEASVNMFACFHISYFIFHIAANLLNYTLSIFTDDDLDNLISYLKLDIDCLKIKQLFISIPMLLKFNFF